MRILTLIAVLGAGFLMCQGCAGTGKAPPKDPRAIFSSFDLNREGRISRNEFMSQIRDHKMGEKLFNELDANGDGYISEAEAAAKPSLMEQASRLTEPPELR